MLCKQIEGVWLSWKNGFIFILLFSALSYPLQSIKAETLEWEKREELPDARVGAVSEVYDGKIYVIGGTGPSKAYSNTTYVYDPKLDKWSEKLVWKQAAWVLPV